ncbi:MAG: hypothetical protein AB7U75_14120 [Hyphomicrobiaceae bacterium]
MDCTFEDLKGKTLSAIEGASVDSDRIVFRTEGDEAYLMYHSQECCEYVRLAEVIGDIDDLIGSEVLLAEEASEHEKDDYESSTWTFYKLSTIKGSVTLRWLGESNGYYSESVDFERYDG